MQKLPTVVAAPRAFPPHVLECFFRSYVVGSSVTSSESVARLDVLRAYLEAHVKGHGHLLVRSFGSSWLQCVFDSGDRREPDTGQVATVSPV